MSRIVINAICAKRIAGGGFQVAMNFVRTAMMDNAASQEYFYLLSSDMAQTLGVDNNEHIRVFPNQPDFVHTYLQVRRELKQWEKSVKPDVIYSLVAPCYFSFKSKEVMRVSNAWVTHPNEYAKRTLTWKDKVYNAIYYTIQRMLIKKGKYFAVQTDYMAEQVARLAKVPRENVKTIGNILPVIYKSLDCTPVQESDYVDIACVAAPYPHKNLDIIPSILKHLRDDRGIINVRIHVTMPESSTLWQRMRDELKRDGLMENVVNHGRLTQEQLAELYRHCQLMFLPTLLEVFSASLLEGMYFQLAIVASDLPFNREVTKDAALYFRPTDGRDAAEKIAEVINNGELREKLIENGMERITHFGDYDGHYKGVISFLEEVAKEY